MRVVVHHVHTPSLLHASTDAPAIIVAILAIRLGDLHHVELLKLVVVLHYADPAYALVTKSEPQRHRQRHKNAYLEDLNEDEVEVTLKKVMTLYEQAKAGIGGGGKVGSMLC